MLSETDVDLWGYINIKTVLLTATLLLIALPVTAQDDMFLELSGYVGGDGDDRIHATAIKKVNDRTFLFMAGNSTSRQSWMPSGPRRGAIAPGCSIKRINQQVTVQCPGVGPNNAFIARYTNGGRPTGFAFIGSSQGRSAITDVAITQNGEVYVSGWTTGELPYANNRYNGGSRDAFVAKIDTSKLDPRDTGAALEESRAVTEWIRHLGGDGRDEAMAIDINVNGFPVVAGNSSSRDFPTRGAETGEDTGNIGDTPVGNIDILQPKYSNRYRGGESDGFVTILASEGDQIHSSYYIGGKNADGAMDLEVANNAIYIAGSTASARITSPWGMVEGGTSSADQDAFLYRNNVVPTAKDTGRIIGSSDSKQEATGVGIIQLPRGQSGVVLAGNTKGSLQSDLGLTDHVPDIPVDTGLPEYNGGESDGFLLLYLSLTDDTSAPDEMRYLGASGSDRIEGLQVLNTDNPYGNAIYVVGSTDSDFFPAVGKLPDKMKRSFGGRDAFMVQLERRANEIQYSGRYGGSGSDRGLDLSVSDRKIFNMVGTTDSGDLPFNHNPARNISGGSDGFIARLTSEKQRPTNLSVSASSPTEFHMENSPVDFNINIENTESTNASGVELYARFNNGTVNAMPSACRKTEPHKVVCSYGEIAGYRGEYNQTFAIDPTDAPKMVKGIFTVETVSREYRKDDNRATSSVEVLSSPDLQVTAIEITQGIQDMRNSIPLVQDKTTYARVYVKATRETVDGGTRMVGIDNVSAELRGWNANGQLLPNAPISPVSTSPTTLEQVEGNLNGKSVTIDDDDRIIGRRATGRVGSGSDGYRYSGARPTIQLSNPSAADTTINHEGTVVITGNTSYTIKAANIEQEDDMLNGFDVTIQADDEVEGNTATGTVSGGADGFTYDAGALKDIELSNPAGATVLVEDRGTILIDGKSKPGATNYQILNVSELDANTDDRTRRETFDFRLPNEWVDTEKSIQLQAIVNPDRSYRAETVTYNNNLKSDTKKLWNLAPVCLRTQPVKTNSGGPDPDLTSYELGRQTLDLGETMLPTPRIRIFPNNNNVTPGIWEAGDTYEFDEDNDNFDSGKVLSSLQWRVKTGTSPNWCDNRGARTHWTGLVNEANWKSGGGGAARGKHPFWFVVSSNSRGWMNINTPRGGNTLAHELGHNYSLGHVDCGGPDTPHENYPFNNCRMGPLGQNKFFGYDTRNPDNAPEKGGQWGIHPDLPSVYLWLNGNISDLMSYANHRWTSSYTWKKLFKKFNRESSNPPTVKMLPPIREEPDMAEAYFTATSSQAGPNVPWMAPGYPATGAPGNEVNSADQQTLPDQLVVVKGIMDINREQFSQLEVVKMDSDILNSNHARELLQGGQKDPDYPVSVQLRGEGGELLESKFVDLQRDYDSGTAALRSFFIALPWDQDAEHVEIAMFGSRLAEKSLAGPAPDVEIEAPTGGEVFDKEDFTARWNVSGVDQPDEVRYLVHYSPDDGENWHSLSINSVSEQVQLLPEDLPGSTDQARIRVTAIYNGRSSTDLSEPFTVKGHAPSTQILTPDSTASTEGGGQVYLNGSAYDIDEGYLTGSALQWTVTAQDSNLVKTASGEQKTLFGLPAGSYKATLTATDADGMQSTATRYFVIGSVDSLTFESPQELRDRHRSMDDGDQHQEEPDEQPSKEVDDHENASFFLVPRGGMSMPGVSSLGSLAGGAGETIQGKQSVITWGGSLVFGSRNGLNLRLTGLHRSGTIATVLQDDRITTTEIEETFSALSAELVLRPFPRILIQPYLVGGLGFRKISQGGQTTTNPGKGWKTAVPLGAGVDLQLADGGVVLGLEAVDYLSGFSGDGSLRHDAFLMGYVGFPLF